jgi:hypothetical protein
MAVLLLIDVKLLHLSLGLSNLLSLFLALCLFSNLSFLQFLHFSCLVCSLFEFFKDILVVEYCVGKFIFENVTTQKLTNTTLNLGCPEDLVNSWAHSWVLLEHASNQAARRVAEIARKGRVLACDNSLSKLVKRLRIEGWLKGGHLVK